jgi:hypothetical protein
MGTETIILAPIHPTVRAERIIEGLTTNLSIYHPYATISRRREELIAIEGLAGVEVEYTLDTIDPFWREAIERLELEPCRAERLLAIH